MSLDPIGGSSKGQGSAIYRFLKPALLRRPLPRTTAAVGSSPMFVFEISGAIFLALFFGAMVTNKHSISH
jgi:hypothetical protein